MLRNSISACLLLLVVSSACADESTADDKHVEFVRAKVLPLLESRCFECHRDRKEHKGGLFLGNRAGALKGGESGPAIVPGKPEESLLVEAIRYEGFEMPPRSRMPNAEVDILVQWVRDGAVWPKDLQSASTGGATEFPLQQRKESHWVWKPITRPAPPKVNDAKWARDTADTFILHQLNEHGLSPAADADRHTLIRRIYFDLTGLPPTVKQVGAFVNDPGNDDEAIARVVDQLLQSPHFGERWGRHWLDLMRYAETLGHEFDYPLRNAYRYRDYVIRAFNEDVPYDLFLKEHLAGDLLSNPRRHPVEKYNESVIGTGFWFLCEDKHSPVDVKGEEAAKIDNQLDVFSRTFLGLTVACARCHDHKFDAISTKDYYALSGYLQSSRRVTQWLDPGQQIGDRVNLLTKHRTAAQEKLASQPAAKELQRYTLAALEALHGTPKGNKPENKADVVFADFEQSSYVGWEVSGDAFGKAPAQGGFPRQQQVSGYNGKQLVNTYRDNDNLQGRLVSENFLVKHNSISFLIGGGNFAGKTCMNLVIDGKTVRTATGRNNEKLLPASWDVSEFKGRTARIEIVDEQQGGWGHVSVDQILFTSDSSLPGLRRDLTKVAAEFKCDPHVLSRWIGRLKDDSSTKGGSALLVPSLLARHGSNGDAILKDWGQLTQPPPGKDETTPFAELRTGLPEDWFVNGHAFEGMTPKSGTGLEWRGKDTVLNAGEGLSSATLSTELRGTLLSPTFELKHPEILVKVAGQATRMRLIIDGYQMYEFNGLLFGGAKQNIETNGEFRWLRFSGDMHRYQGHRMHIEFLDEGNGWFNVQEVRFANRRGANPAGEPVHDVNVSLAGDVRFDGSREQVVAKWAAQIAKDSALESSVAMSIGLSSEADAEDSLEAFRKAAQGIAAPTPVLAIMDGTGEDEFIFIRGSHRNPGPVAERTILTALQRPDTAPVASGSGRLDLANQLLDDSNPLVARVAVNRIWHHLFGRGIVESTDNFGVLGKQPTHPELLDHLATRFRTDGWSVKKMIRSLMLSRAYRMSSSKDPAAESTDPTNQHFHRANIRRLQGEAVRDGMLVVSGRLDRTQFGPSIPLRLTAFMQGRGRPRQNGPVDGNGRRSIYLAVNRNFLSPFMLAFDVPAPVTTIGKRTISNVPAQALIMLNNEFVRQQSQVWAERLLKESHANNEQLIAAAWLQLLSRPASADDLQPLLEFAGDEALNKETLTEICHVLLNSKEYLFLH